MTGLDNTYDWVILILLSLTLLLLLLGRIGR